VLAGAAHLNHQLRPEAARDEMFCRELCARLDVPFIAAAAPVAALAGETHVSVEVAARRARYAFLERARTSCDAATVAVAHTTDDQAETVLLRLLRGAGPRGLRGILPRRGTVVRPLLDCTRAALRAELARRGETWVEDATNADVTQPRNRVRHELMPQLAERFQPAVTRVLARTAEVVAADDALLESLADAAAPGVVAAAPGGLAISMPALSRLPLALARRLARRSLERAGAPHAPDLADVEALLAVCRPGGPAAAEAAGLRVERFSEDAVLLIVASGAAAATWLSSRSLPVPGTVGLPELGPGCRLVATGPIQTVEEPADLHRRLIVKASVPTPFQVRGRTAGDRIRPRGLGGSKKLQDLLVDRKVPRAERDRVPVVADATGRIVWVIGHAVDADAAASGDEGDVIVLTFDQPAPSGSEGS
jgi:tRNA(Ile)-lysidine synthase